MNSRFLLLASAAANLFLLGVLAALFLPSALHPPHRQPGPLREVAQSLDEAHRQSLLEVFRENGRAVRPLVRQAKLLRSGVWGELAAPSFDPMQAKAELARARELNDEASGKVQDALIDYAAGLPLDQRRALAAALEERMPPPRPAREASGGPPGSPPPRAAASGAPAS